MDPSCSWKEGKILDLKLSKGQKKRVAQPLALAEERDIILLDEWAADRDPHFRREFYQVLLPLMQQMGKTVFAISHDDHYFPACRSPAGDAQRRLASSPALSANWRPATRSRVPPDGFADYPIGRARPFGSYCCFTADKLLAVIISPLALCLWLRPCRSTSILTRIA